MRSKSNRKPWSNCSTGLVINGENMFEVIKCVGGGLVLLLLLGIAPVVVGTVFIMPMRRENSRSLTFAYLVGIMVMVGLSELLSVPLTILKQSFSTFVGIQNAIVLVLCIVAVMCYRKELYQIIQTAIGTIKLANRMWILVLLGVYVPLIILAFVEPYIYGDDTTYLSMVNDMVYSDRLYLTDIVTGAESGWVAAKYSLSSFWAWLAYLAKTTGIHPLVLCKTILPFVFVPMSYAVQGIFASYLFKNNERKMLLYMLLVILVSIFGGFTNYTVTYRLYTWSWQSKAFLAMIVIPFLLYYCNYVFESATTIWEYFLLLIMIVAACATTLTGTGLAVVMVCAIACIYSVIRKRIDIIINTLLVCSPAYVLILLYLVYDQFMYLIQFD